MCAREDFSKFSLEHVNNALLLNIGMDGSVPATKDAYRGLFGTTSTTAV